MKPGVVAILFTIVEVIKILSSFKLFLKVKAERLIRIKVFKTYLFTILDPYKKNWLETGGIAGGVIFCPSRPCLPTLRPYLSTKNIRTHTIK